MSALPTALNYSESNIVAESQIITRIESGVSHFPVENTNSFTAPKSIVVGRGENAEILVIQSVSSQEIVTTGNSRFAHDANEPIICLLGNKVRFYSSPNVNGFPPSDDAFTALAEVTIVADQLETTYLDAAGGTDTWYKAIYFDSNSNDYTDLADSPASRGGDYGHLVDVRDVRDEAGLKENRYIDNAVVVQKRNEAESEILGVCASAGYALPLKDSKGNLYTPAVIERLARDLAAGFLLTKEYGSGAPATTDVGLSKIKNSRDTLKLIAANTLILLGPDNVPLSQQEQVAGQPDEDTDESGDTSTPEEPKFTMNQKF